MVFIINTNHSQRGTNFHFTFSRYTHQDALETTRSGRILCSDEKEAMCKLQLHFTMESFWEGEGLSPLDCDTEKVGFMILRVVLTLPRLHRGQTHLTF